MSILPSYLRDVRSSATYQRPLIRTRDPRGTQRGAATVLPATGRVPDAVMPAAFGPQHTRQAQ